MTYAPTADVLALREAVDHRIIDSDGHLIEYTPVVRDFVVEDAGEDIATMFDHMTRTAARRAATPDRFARRELGLHATSVWALPTANTLDRATAMLPDLMYRRLDQFGVDFAVLYPTYGLTVTMIPNTELRCAIARAFNRYYAEAYGPYGDRLAPVAAIPTFSPEEAIAELDYAVGELGLKAVMMGGVIPRETENGRGWIDTLSHDSSYDYDPLWQRCVELGVAPTFHAGGQGWGSRQSTTNNSYNQVGNFAAAAEATCRSLVYGGVPMRFPELHFAFQEGGVSWAVELLAGLLGHFEKRRREAIEHNDPARLDRDLLAELFSTHAHGAVAAQADRLGDALTMLSDANELASDVDMFGESLVTKPEEIVAMFTDRFFFGCEADDPLNAMAFNTDLNPSGARLPAIFSSDVGHWDVRDMTEVVPEAYELVEHGQITEADFKAFVYDNPVKLWTAMNPGFFADTVIDL